MQSDHKLQIHFYRRKKNNNKKTPQYMCLKELESISFIEYQRSRRRHIGASMEAWKIKQISIELHSVCSLGQIVAALLRIQLIANAPQRAAGDAPVNCFPDTMGQLQPLCLLGRGPMDGMLLSVSFSSLFSPVSTLAFQINKGISKNQKKRLCTVANYAFPQGSQISESLWCFTALSLIYLKNQELT